MDTKVETQVETQVAVPEGEKDLPALSARVEAEVFGRKVLFIKISDNIQYWRSFPVDFTIEAARAENPGEEDAMLYAALSTPVPPYAEIDAEALKLAEVMAERGFWMNLKYAYTPGYGCWVNFDHQGCSDPNPLYRGHGDKIAEAICKAALAVVNNLITSRSFEE